MGTLCLTMSIQSLEACMEGQEGTFSSRRIIFLKASSSLLRTFQLMEGGAKASTLGLEGEL